MKAKQKISILFALTFVPALSHAQSVVNSSGNSISNPNLIVEYSIGEIVTTTIQSGQDAVTQGLLQPTYQIVSGINEEFDKSFTFNAFPPHQVFRTFLLRPSTAPQQCLRPAANYDAILLIFATKTT